MISIGFNESDSFVERMARKGVNVRWDGWNMVFFKADRRARTATSGRYRDGVWGFETIVRPNRAGKWMINPRLTKVDRVAA